ncbi:hypothetical protein ABZ412_25525 [Nocardia sp. NPDC005746]|uniref:hypothetical protein n=1 Tax=Nocardia sp. NPDC005746 TaxID=3157062 RepID=UPI003407F04A
MGSSDDVGRRSHRFRRPLAVVAGLVAAVTVTGLLPGWWCGRDADAWFRGDPGRVHGLAEELLAFEAADDQRRAAGSGGELTDMWGLLAHQMTALGLAQISLDHPEWRARYAPVATRAAAKTLRPEMRPVFTAAWPGEDGVTVPRPRRDPDGVARDRAGHRPGLSRLPPRGRRGHPRPRRWSIGVRGCSPWSVP